VFEGPHAGEHDEQFMGVPAGWEFLENVHDLFFGAYADIDGRAYGKAYMVIFYGHHSPHLRDFSSRGAGDLVEHGPSGLVKRVYGI